MIIVLIEFLVMEDSMSILIFIRAFLLIWVIGQLGFYTCPMDKGCIQWIVLKTETFLSYCGELQT